MNISLCYRSVDPNLGGKAKHLIEAARDNKVNPALEAAKAIVLKKFPQAEWPEKVESWWADVEEVDETDDGQPVYEWQLLCEVNLIQEGFCPYSGSRNAFDEYDVWRLHDEKLGEYSEPLATVDEASWGELKILCRETGDYWDIFLDKCVTCLVEFSSIRVVPSYSNPGELHFYNNQDWL